MAQGDVVFFEQFLIDVLEGVHNLETDTINLGLVTNVTVPVVGIADPHWGGTGTTNFATNQVAIGGAYTGPVALLNPSVTWANLQAEIDWDDPPTWAQNGASPVDATWAIVYNDTSVNKKAIGFVDIGGAFDMTTGDLTIAFGTPAAYLDHA